MLYDPKWNEKKPDIWSLDNFTNWISIQNQDKEYTYYSPNNCLIARYLKEHGLKNVTVGTCSVHYHASRLPGWIAWIFSSRVDKRLPDRWNWIAAGAGHKYCTFGSALARAKQAKAEHIDYTNAELVH